jgi:hypothetical protein
MTSLHASLQLLQPCHPVQLIHLQQQQQQQQQQDGQQY